MGSIKGFNFRLMMVFFIILGISPVWAFEATREPPAPQHQKWTHVGPGGGGWFKSLAFSPNGDKLLVGGDLSGVHVSDSSFQNFTISNDGPGSSVGLINLYIQSLVFNPINSSIVYAGTRGGVAKSLDGGGTWTMKRSGFTATTDFGVSESIFALCIDTQNPDTLYAGLGVTDLGARYPLNTQFGYVYKTVDGGDNWTSTAIKSGGVTLSESIMAIDIDPNNSSKLYLLSRTHFFKSIDAGATWTEYATLPLVSERAYTDMTVSRSNADIIYLSYYRTATPYQSGVLKSIDGGTTWSDSLPAKIMPNAQSGVIGIYRHPLDSNTLFVAFHRSSLGLWRTTDAGANWSQINLTLTAADSWPWITYADRGATAFAINPTNPNIFCYTTSAAVYLSSDNAVTWDQRASIFNDPYANSTGLDILSATTTLIKQDDPSTLLLSNYDVNLFKSDDGGKSVFKEADPLYDLWGSAPTMAADPSNANTVYVARGPGRVNMSLYKSTNFGKDFTLIAYPYPGANITRIIVDPVDPQILYLATKDQGVLKSIDGGTNWSAINTNLPADNLGIVDIAMNPNDRMHLAVAAPYYKGINGYVAMSTDGGSTWTVTLGRNALGVELVSSMDAYCVAFDSDPTVNILYAGNRDYSSRGKNKIFWRSTDGGSTWAYTAGTVFNTRPAQYSTNRYYYLKTITTDPVMPGRVYIGFRAEEYDYNLGDGIFFSDDYGVNWQSMQTTITPTGLPALRINRLNLDPINTSRLYASTAGSGTWYYGTPPARDPVGIAHWRFDEASGSVANDSFTNQYNGTLVGSGVTQMTGKYNNSLSFDGTSYVDVGTACDQLNPVTSAYTFNAWVYPQTLDVIDPDYNNNLFCKYQDASNYFYFNFHRADSIQFYALVNGVGYNASFTNIPTNLQFTKLKWHMLSIVIDRHASTLTAYHNGELIGTTSFAGTANITNTGQFQIGRYNATGGYFNGRIDDLRFYRNVFTAEQLKKWFMAEAYWKLNKIAADNKLHDENQVNNATPSNLTTSVDGAAVFDGTSSFVNAGNDSSLKPGTDDLSIAFWIKPAVALPTGSRAGILFKGNGDLNIQNGWIVRYLNQNGIGGRLYFSMGDGTRHMGSVYIPSYTEPLPVGIWTHIAIVVSRSAKTIETYVNGTLKSTTALNDAVPASNVTGPDLRMGNDWNNAQFFNGELDEVRIYRWPLTANDLKLDQ